VDVVKKNGSGSGKLKRISNIKYCLWQLLINNSSLNGIFEYLFLSGIASTIQQQHDTPMDKPTHG
jgi:hypothetical protein